MSREEITMTLAIANFILTWGVALYMYLANKNKATNERIGKLEDDISDKIDGHSGRITHLETVAEMAPTHHDLAQVYESQKKTDEKLNKLIGENEGQSAILRTILTQITQKGLA
jgi:hypothetical protein